MNNKKITLGFVLAAVSTVLAIVGLFLYKSVGQQIGTTNTLLILAAVAGAAALVLALVLGKEIPNFFLIAHAVLLMAAVGVSVAPVVNDMGLVFAGLYQMDIINAYITFAVVACVAWLVSVVASFLGVTPKEA
ncbi:MAG: hypothetical protein IJQ46_05225 [Oscillospiraceae bacterium]|nr:hypothetical protein [Oscillospiraceae bacterium]MBR0210857.1 hypothetical protein [Oscillospiraceae bacterium]MBR0211771.1 hypothetical protein [Oscillospiraceae bacterium]